MCAAHSARRRPVRFCPDTYLTMTEFPPKPKHSPRLPPRCQHTFVHRPTGRFASEHACTLHTTSTSGLIGSSTLSAVVCDPRMYTLRCNLCLQASLCATLVLNRRPCETASHYTCIINTHPCLFRLSHCTSCSLHSLASLAIFRRRLHLSPIASLQAPMTDITNPQLTPSVLDIRRTRWRCTQHLNKF